jgi:hypothetical protein
MTGYQSKRAAAQAKMVQWANEAFNDWWNNDYDDSTNPYEKDTFAYWAWAGWQEALAQLEQKEKFCDSNCVWTDHHPDCNLAQSEQDTIYRLSALVRAQQITIDKLEAQPKQEPVAWMKTSDTEWSISFFKQDGYVPLYTTPPQRKPLEDEEICPWFQKNTALTNEAAMRIVRAIEAAHGIKENT